jgi:hypothetical protein
MDASEKIVANFLAHRGYVAVVYEPDGGVPPDFLVDGHIAVEVRRLNENYEVGTRRRAREEIEIPLWQKVKVKELALSLGPPTQDSSWFVSYRFRRPVEPWRKLKPKVHRALEGFIKAATHQETIFALGNGFELKIFRASNPHPTFYVMGSADNYESGCLLVKEMARNLRICISEKTKKIASVRSKYAEWWLVLVDHIAYGCLEDLDLSQLRGQLSVRNDWKKIIVADPQDPTRAFEI